MEEIFEGLNKLYGERDQAFEEGNMPLFELLAKQCILVGAAYDAGYGIGYEDVSMLNPKGAEALEESYQRVLARIQKGSTRGE